MPSWWKIGWGAALMVALVSFGRSQGLPADDPRRVLVTFETPTRYLPDLLAELTKVSGVSLRLAANLREERLILRAENVPLEQVMARIGEALGASWLPEQGGFRLVRTSAMARAEEQQSLQIRRAEVQNLQAKAALAREKLPPPNPEQWGADLKAIRAASEAARTEEDAERVQLLHEKFVERLPDSRFAMDLLVGADANVLARLETGDRIVYSNKPNPSQRPLSPAQADAFRRFLATLGQAQEAVRNALDPKLARESFAGLLPFDDLTGARVLVTFSREPMSPGIQLQIRLVDRSGYVISESEEGFGSEDGFGFGSPEVPDQGGAKPIVLSPLSTELKEALEKFSVIGSGGRPSLSPELSRFILNPERNDLSALVASDLVLGMARNQQKNVVCSPTGELGILILMLVLEGVVSAPAVEASITRPLLRMTLKRDGNWLVLRAADPHRERLLRVSPSAVGTTVRSIAAHGYADLGELARLAGLTRTVEDALAALLPLLVISPDFAESLSESAWPVLQIYHSLGPLDRASLTQRNGVGLFYGQATPYQRLAIERLIYTNRFRRASPVPEGETRQLVSHVEPTEAFPNGLPPALRLQLVESRKPVYYAKFGENSEVSFTAAELASVLAGRAASEEGKPAPLVHVAAGEQRSLRAMLTLGQAPVLSEEVTSTRSSGAKVTRWQDLPPVHRQALEEALRRVQSQPANQPDQEPPRLARRL